MTVRCGIVHTMTIARATSSACIIVARAFASGTSGRLSRIGVSTSAGTIVVARMPLLRSSVCRACIIARAPALATPYATPENPPGRSAASDATVTTVPAPRSSIDGSTLCVSA